MADDLTDAQKLADLAEHAYWKEALVQLGLRPIFIQGVKPGAGGLLLLPSHVKDQDLVTALRACSRGFGQMATQVEEELRRVQPAPVLPPEPTVPAGVLKGLIG